MRPVNVSRLVRNERLTNEVSTPTPQRTSLENDFTAFPQLGIPIHRCNMNGALDRIESFIEEGRLSGRSHQITTVNSDFLVHALRFEDIHAILRGADLSLADGMPLVWASRALGVRLPERVTGADLVPALAARAAKRGHRLLFFGGWKNSAEGSAQILRNAYPDLIVSSLECRVGPKGETEEDKLDEIRAFDADVICVALGHPKQERWIRTHASSLGIPVAIGVGGTFDFLASHQKRAPEWIGNMGFEWLHRLLHEPSRLTKRYFGSFAVYVPAILRQISRSATSGQRTATVAKVVGTGPDSDVAVLTEGRIGRQTVKDLTAAAVRARGTGHMPKLVLPSYDQLRALQRERIDRMFLFIPDPTQGPDQRP